MPITDTSTLIISARSDSANVEKFTSAVDRADQKSKELLKTLGGFVAIRSIKRLGDQSVRSFSEMWEQMNRFQITYNKVLPEAELKFEALRKEFDLDRKSAYSMLAASGDILTGFGMAPAVALKFADSVARLGTDLYAYTNYAGGAEGATMALTKALIGNSKQAQMLGIVIRKESEEYKNLVKEGMEVYRYSELEAKAYASLQIAIKQSKNAIGDYTRATGSYNNSVQRNLAITREFRQAIGEQLVPVYHKAIDAQSYLMKLFNNASPEWQRAIILTGTLTSAMVALKTAIGIKSAAEVISGKLGIGASRASVKATSEEIAMEKALQKVKLANLSLDQARGNVAKGRSELALAEGARDSVFRTGSGNIEALQEADAKVKLASEQLSIYEKALKKAEENALKASNAVSVMNSQLAMESTNRVQVENALRLEQEARSALLKSVGSEKKTQEIIDEITARQKNIAMIHAENQAKAISEEINAVNNGVVTQLSKEMEARKKLVDIQQIAERASEESAKKLAEADKKMAEARKRLVEANRGVKETGLDWRMSKSDDDYQEYRFQKGLQNTAKGDFAAAAADVKKYEEMMNQANEATQKANEALKEFDLSRAKEKEYLAGLEENVAAQKARAKALGSGKDALTAQRAAEEAYNGVLKKQAETVKIAEEAENLRKNALKMGATETEALAVKTAYLNNVNEKSVKGAGLLTRSMKGIATGAKAAGVALKSLAVSFLPMLAVSAAIAGVDYLINRTKRAAEAQNTLAEKDAQAAKNLLASNDALRKSDREKLLQFEQLASYTNKTAKEQELLNNLTNELNKTYAGLNLPLLKQNETLKDTSKLWDEINKKQLENRKADLKNVYSKDARSLQTEGMKLREKANTFMSTKSDRNAIRDATNITDLEQRQRVLMQMRGVYAKKENVGMVEAIDDYLAKMEQMKKSRKAYYDAVNQEAPKGKQTSDKKPIQESLEALKNFKKESESFKEKKWEFEFEFADPKKKVKMLDDQLKDLGKKRDDALQRAPHDRAQQTEAIKISSKMMDIEKQKASIMKSADAERVSKLEEQKRKLDEQMAVEKQFAMSLYQSHMKFRETAMAPTSSNSTEAIRLQSRTFLGGGDGLSNLQKQTADSTKKSAQIASESKQIQQKMEEALKAIYSKIEGFATSSVGG